MVEIWYFRGCVNTFQPIAHYDISRSNIDVSKQEYLQLLCNFKYFIIIFKYYSKKIFRTLLESS